MKVILFGAGASYGSEHVFPNPPPLGGQLFNVLRRDSPLDWGTITGSLRDEFEVSFERGMGALLASGSHALPVLMQRLAIFFAQFRPVQSNTYAELVEKLAATGKLSEIAFASLNYECLFEIAASTPNRPINYFGSHDPSTHAVTVWKLHGSCNFLPGPEITASRGVSYGSGVLYNTSVRVVDPAQVPGYCLSNTALYPAMAHYAKGKQVQIAQPVIQRLQVEYAEAVSSATTVAIVGVKPNVEDPHVWRPLAGTPADLLIVGDEEDTRRWAGGHRDMRPTQYLGAHFRSSLDELVRAL